MFAEDRARIEEAIQILWGQMASSEDPDKELEEMAGLRELDKQAEAHQKGCSDAATRNGH